MTLIEGRSLDAQERDLVLLARVADLPRLGRLGWVHRRNGVDGLGLLDHPKRGLRVIHSIAREADGEVWAHVSVSRLDRKMPSWETTRDVFREVVGDGVIVVPPASEHVNVAEVAHVWACLTRRPLPDFTRGTGSI